MSKLAKFYPTFLLGYSLLPLAVNAATLDSAVGQLKKLLDYGIGLIFSIAVLIFLWGVVQFIAKSSDEVARNKAKGIIYWGIIGMAIMASAWGLVNILVNFFQLKEVAPDDLPRVPAIVR